MTPIQPIRMYHGAVRKRDVAFAVAVMLFNVCVFVGIGYFGRPVLDAWIARTFT